MNPDERVPGQGYVIPSRTITGSPQQILDEIDDMMEALRTVRETVLRLTPRPTHVVEHGWRARLHWLLRFPPPPFRRST